MSLDYREPLIYRFFFVSSSDNHMMLPFMIVVFLIVLRFPFSVHLAHCRCKRRASINVFILHHIRKISESRRNLAVHEIRFHLLELKTRMGLIFWAQGSRRFAPFRALPISVKIRWHATPWKLLRQRHTRIKFCLPICNSDQDNLEGILSTLRMFNTPSTCPRWDSRPSRS